MLVRLTKILPILIAFGITGCGMMPYVNKVLPDRKVDYKKEKQAETDLEVPPDLTKSSIDDARMVPDISPAGTATYSDYVSERKAAGATSGAVMPQIGQLEMRRDGDVRWLVAQAPVKDVWYKVISFWRENDILLLKQDAKVGLMRTDWIENRADNKSSFVPDFMRKAFGGTDTAATRDQYRVRLEAGKASGTTEIYLTHRGMEETSREGAAGGDGQATWVTRPTDRGLETEMMRRMMVFFGAPDKRIVADLAQQDERQPRSQLISNKGRSELKVMEEFSRAWRLTGMALDRGGFAVEDQDRGEGIYFVRNTDSGQDAVKKKGFFSKLAFWEDGEVEQENQYQIRVIDAGKTTIVVIQNSKGIRDNSATAKRILELLHEQLK
ncbi:hypothetical protein MNBD_GAMMA26-1352 [hydrothermal vent metagenome]|uniref:Outer membrane protein assembly factor BamC n=1 Tax=hydrothermal vent metagenome TaxID=652676 RepID=A0A3B1BGB4_9ZZZZ